MRTYSYLHLKHPKGVKCSSICEHPILYALIHDFTKWIELKFNTQHYIDVALYAHLCSDKMVESEQGRRHWGGRGGHGRPTFRPFGKKMAIHQAKSRSKFLIISYVYYITSDSSIVVCAVLALDTILRSS